MNAQSRKIIAVVLTGIWVNASEFFRNEVLLKKYWVDHYQSLGMTFPSAPKNGMIWVAWGFLFSIAIYLISRRFNLIQTALISWFMAFVLMWVVTLESEHTPRRYSYLCCSVEFAGSIYRFLYLYKNISK